MTIKLIVGLKNPGEQYAKTRHNAGAWVLEALANSMPTTWATKKDMLGEIAEWIFPSGKVLALLPTTFMNLNGQSVSAVARYYRIESNEILVAHDDLDLPVGAVRLKKGGGHGGHNGLQDLIRHLGSNDFYRLRMGIGHPGDKTQVANYVLNAPTASERKLLTDAVEQVLPYIPRIVQGDIEAVMNSLHRR
jgi:PTH1 family peptidyl-tRNA hydrolase